MDQLKSSKPLDKCYIAASVVRCIFFISDLILTFTPISRLKSKLSHVSKAISELPQLPPDIQRSVSLGCRMSLPFKKCNNIINLQNHFHPSHAD